MHGVNIERDHHNGHRNDDEDGFVECVPVMVHAETEDEAREIMNHVADEYLEEETDDAD